MVVLVPPAIVTTQPFPVGEIQIQNDIKSATRDALNPMTYTAAAGSYLTWTATETWQCLFSCSHIYPIPLFFFFFPVFLSFVMQNIWTVKYIEYFLYNISC